MVASLVTQLALSGGGGQIVTTATKVVIKPLEDRVVVRPLDAEQTTASGLVIPDTAKEKPQEGEVIAVGPGRFDDAGTKRVPMDVKVGDVVLYSKYGGTEVNSPSLHLPLPTASTLLAVIDNSPTSSQSSAMGRAPRARA